jgi:hypothetical protein
MPCSFLTPGSGAATSADLVVGKASCQRGGSASVAPL